MKDEIDRNIQYPFIGKNRVDADQIKTVLMGGKSQCVEMKNMVLKGQYQYFIIHDVEWAFGAQGVRKNEYKRIW